MIFVADNLTITDRRVENALAKMEPEYIQALVKKCEDAGADAIDVNVGPLGRHCDKIMDFVVRSVQETTDLPILLDTANPDAMKAGLLANRKTAVINGFSLEPKKLEKILPLAKTFDVDIIGYLLHPDSRVPANADERLSLAVEIHGHVQSVGIDPARLILDPVIVPLTWDSGKPQARAVISTLRHLPEVLGFPVRTIAGISNLTAGKGNMDKKRLMEEIYLSFLTEAGLTMALLNIFHEKSLKIATACNELADERIFSWNSF
jgi:5-methyltetrahydrofolate corrinoid/iron sulfur protein methyltransferase